MVIFAYMARAVTLPRVSKSRVLEAMIESVSEGYCGGHFELAAPFKDSEYAPWIRTLRISNNDDHSLSFSNLQGLKKPLFEHQLS